MSLKLNYDKRNLKVIQLSDVHVSYPINQKPRTAIKKIIEVEKPDFIVFSGDLFHHYHLKVDGLKLIYQFIDFIEAFNVKYAYCFGNHDGEINVQKREVYEILSENSPHFSGEIGPVEATKFHDKDCQYHEERIGNFVIEFMLNDEHCFDLAMLDSGRYNIEGKYGSITPHQTKFFDKQLNGSDVPLLVFFHIPLRAHKELYFSNRISGVRREQDCYQPDEYGFFEMLERTKREIFMFCGHDHTNDYCLKYNNISFGITPGLCYEQYNDDEIRGYRVFEINQGITTEPRKLQSLNNDTEVSSEGN